MKALLEQTVATATAVNFTARKSVWLVACIAALAWQSSSLAVERIALVVGNGAYQHVPALDNPRNDAEDMESALQAVGFEVVAGTDLDRLAFYERIDEFARRARGAKTALFFYAGHGIQLGEANYLLPVDAEQRSEWSLKGTAVKLDEVLENMGSAARLVFLDACRDNPFLDAVARSRGVRSSSMRRGLARVEAAGNGGMFIAYATAPGDVAADGGGRNSPFTAGLKEHLGEPGLEINQLINRVRRSVAVAHPEQRPWHTSSLHDDFYFSDPHPVGRPGAGVDAPDPETEAWLQIRETANAGLLERFLATYPNGRYSLSAQARLDELRQRPFTVAVEPSGARVRILNIAQPYQARMNLPAGEYRVEASAPGYETKTETVTHRRTPTVHRMTLRKAGPKVGDQFRDCPACPEMVVVPAGSYRMGSPSSEEGQPDERPVHEVTIAVPFAIGRHEVTVAEFGRFADATGYSTGNSCRTFEGGDWKSRAGRGWRNPGFGQSGRHPVACVSWNDAQAYVAWLSRETGEEYRLPSESEWEYAARAGTATARYWGDDESRQCRHANGADASAKERYSDWTAASCRDGHAHTAPVGSFATNGWGLHDVLGNVWEWTEDCWNNSYAGAPSDGSAWEYGECSERVLRGGSWDSEPSVLRAAVRFWNSTGDRNYNVGFRVARTLAP